MKQTRRRVLGAAGGLALASKSAAARLFLTGGAAPPPSGGGAIGYSVVVRMLSPVPLQTTTASSAAATTTLQFAAGTIGAITTGMLVQAQTISSAVSISSNSSPTKNGETNPIPKGTTVAGVNNTTGVVTLSANIAGFGIGNANTIQVGTCVYNWDGTISGTPGGPTYTYNPDTPDSHTTSTDLGNFVSDFAGFTQGCRHCVRDDTDLHVWFRKDVSPDPTKIEITLEHGKYTSDASGKNLAPCSVQIFKAGVAQPIAVFTRSGLGNTWVPGGATFTGYTQVTTIYLPQLGRWTYKTFWNNGGATPFTGDPGFAPCRPLVRTNTQLLPGTGNLNLVPNINNALGTAYGATTTNTAPTIPSCSSAWSATSPYSSNFNPVGVNESLELSYSIGGVGGRPDLGIVNEYCARWIATGSDALSMLVLGEVDGGTPWHLRDGTITGWGPHDFNVHPTYGWFWGFSGTPFNFAPYTGVDSPTVPVPSTSWGAWSPDLYHTSSISYVPYIATGDPRMLVNCQDKFLWLLGSNYAHRQGGYVTNYFVPVSSQTYSARFDLGIVMDGSQSRGRGWHERDLGQAFLGIPASVPSWILPRSALKAIGDANQQYLDTWVANQNAAYPEMAWSGNVFPAGDVQYGYYTSYETMALAFLLNQCGWSNWLNFTTFIAQSIVPLATGSTGYDNRWTHQFGYWTVYFSNDYTSTYASKPTSWGDTYTFGNHCAMVEANPQNLTRWGVDLGGGGQTRAYSKIRAWAPSTSYHCNSWIVDFRGGVPVVPNVGDVVALTISGTFTGSPVTVSYTITSGDQITLRNLAGASWPDPGSYTHPVINGAGGWMSQINANPTLSAAGIVASLRCDNWGVGALMQGPRVGEMYISFNSDGSSSLSSAPVIGPITVTGTYTPNGTPTNCSLYIQANGDGVVKGNAGAALYGREIAYQCVKSHTSPTTGGPTGTALQTPVGDGTNSNVWMFIPEQKGGPVEVPGGPLTTGRSGWGTGGTTITDYDDSGTNPGYIFWAMGALAGLSAAGITGASTGRTTIKAFLNDWKSRNGNPPAGGAAISWCFAIAPY